MTNNADNTALKDERTGICAINAKVYCPRPETITKEREARRKVITSLSATFNKPTINPKMTRRAYKELLIVDKYF